MTKPGDLPATDWKEEYKKEHKLRQEAEGEMSILKTISVHSSPEMKKANEQIKDLQNSLERFKKENNDLYNKIADLTEVAQSKDYFRDPDYQYLIEENQRLEQERNELLVVNKKLNEANKVDRARKAGM
jgi:predicted RNase H-like nuclease (RuvC/YqgF family)